MGAVHDGRLKGLVGRPEGFVGLEGRELDILGKEGNEGGRGRVGWSPTPMEWPPDGEGGGFRECALVGEVVLC